MYRRLKSFLILAFVALAIFLTGQLWFVNLSNRNFFLYLAARWNPSVAEGYREFVRPMRFIYGDGTGRFDKSYSGLMDAHSRTYFDAVLTELFDSGTFLSVSTTDYVRLHSRPVLIYEYAFPMPANIFPLGFNQRTGGFLTTRGIGEFTSVAIWLPYEAEGISVFFIGHGQKWEFNLDMAGLDGFPVIPVSTVGLHFVSAVLEGYDNLPPGTFVPRSGDQGRFPFSPAIVTNPYLTHAGASLNYIRNRVAPFFDNPATMRGRVAGDGVWTYSNIHTTVRYFATEVLEYASFRPRRPNATSSLMGDFSAALAFIDNDNLVDNEIFLKGFEARGDGYVFWFGYILGYFPILMPDGWLVAYGDVLPAPIEVVVSQGRVVLYRRLAHNFSLATDYQWLTEGALNYEALLQGHEEPVLDLSLGYMMNQTGNLRLELLARRY